MMRVDVGVCMCVSVCQLDSIAADGPVVSSVEKLPASTEPAAGRLDDARRQVQR